MSTDRVRKIPRHAFIDEDSFFNYLYKPRQQANTLYRELARTFHDALPDEVADCLVDELMNAEARGELEQYRIENHMEKIVDLFTSLLQKLAIPVEGPDGSTSMAVPLEDLGLLKNARAMNRIMR
jgi:hypothetical protein